MNIFLAKSAGFCFGVKNAVDTVNELIKSNCSSIHTLGPIIHNEQVVNDLESQGVKILNDHTFLNTGDNVVIRAHGIKPKIFTELKSKNIKIYDATCPYVKKIHSLVEEKFSQGYKIIIVGDYKHPEVVGINGYCNDEAIIINDKEDVDNISKKLNKICVVAQTTLGQKHWDILTTALRNKFGDISENKTICGATVSRQKEAEEIAKVVDLMYIVGGRNSSNTQKLLELSSEYCRNTIKIETADEIKLNDLKNIKNIGITAGASTPSWVIEEVIKKMSTENNNNEEFNFMEEMEKTFFSVKNGDIIKGKVTTIKGKEIFVEFGFKFDAVIPKEELSYNDNFDIEDFVKIGDTIEAVVLKIDNSEGIVLASIKKLDAVNVWDDLNSLYESKEILNIKANKVVNGGLTADYKGVRIFIPASQLDEKFVDDLNEYVGVNLKLRIIQLDRFKKKVVASRKVIIAEDNKEQLNGFWDQIEVGKNYKGTVKNLTSFGAFIDLGGIDGLIHISELSWKKIDHPRQVLTVNESVDVYVKDFDRTKDKINLGYKKSEENPWLTVEEDLEIGQVLEVKVRKIVPFGIFVEIKDGIDALIHISKLSDSRIKSPKDIVKIGDCIKAKIVTINIDEKKISLTSKLSDLNNESAVEETEFIDKGAEFTVGNASVMSIEEQTTEQDTEQDTEQTKIEVNKEPKEDNVK